MLFHHYGFSYSSLPSTKETVSTTQSHHHSPSILVYLKLHNILTSELAIYSVEESIDITFVNENENVLQSSLHFYLQRLLEKRELTLLVIINDFTISFVGKENDFIVMSLP